MQQIHILYVTTSDRMAGAEKNIFDLLKRLNRKRFKPHLVIFKHEKNGELGERVRSLGIPVTYLGIQKKYHVLRLWKLWRLIQSIKPNILESFLFFDNQVCRIFGKLLGVRTIISGQQNVETKRSKLRTLIDRLTIRYANAVISNSDAGKQYYVTQGDIPAEKIFLAKSAIDMDELRCLQEKHVRTVPRRIWGIAIPDDYQVALTVGYLTEQKGISYLIGALVLLKERGVKVMSFVIGQGVLEASLRLEAQKCGVEQLIHFVGFQSKSFQYNRLFDLYVLPSLWEGLPNVIIEAMASELLVVGTEVGGMSELITNNESGFLVPPANTNLLADAIERAVSLPHSQREKIVRTAKQKIIDVYSIETMVQAYEQCYEHFS